MTRTWLAETADATAKAAHWSTKNRRWRRMPHALRAVGSTVILTDVDYRPLAHVSRAIVQRLRLAGAVNERNQFFDEDEPPWRAGGNRAGYLHAVRLLLRACERT